MMHLATAEDIPNIHRIINDPTVRQYLGPGKDVLNADHLIDKAPLFCDETGIILADPMGDGEYLGLSAMLPGGRGFHSIVAHREILYRLFTEFDAWRILVTVDPGNRNSQRLLAAMGFIPIYDGGSKINGELDFTEWALHSRQCRDAGRELESLMRRELQAGERNMLGAFILTTQNSRGNFTGKAFRLFNRYARLKGLDYLAPLDENWTQFIYAGEKFKITYNGVTGVGDGD